MCAGLTLFNDKIIILIKTEYLMLDFFHFPGILGEWQMHD